MYAYFDGTQWIETNAREIKALAKNGIIKPDTWIRMPGGRDVTADKITGLEFAAIPVAPAAVPVPLSESPQNTPVISPSHAATFRNHDKVRQTIELKILHSKITYYACLAIAAIAFIIAFAMIFLSKGVVPFISVILFPSAIAIAVVGHINYRMTLLPSQMMLIFIDLSEDVEKMMKNQKQD